MFKKLKHKWKAYLERKGKINVYRDIIYIVISLHICYFMYGIHSVTTDFAENELAKDLNEAYNGEITKDSFLYQEKYIIDYNLTTGGVIRNVAFKILQIIFLIAISSMIYTDSMIRRYGNQDLLKQDGIKQN